MTRLPFLPLILTAALGGCGDERPAAPVQPPAAERPGEELVVPPELFQAGDAFTRVATMIQQVEGGAELRVDAETRTEILAVAAGQPTKVRQTYTRIVVTTTVNGSGRSMSPPRAGKSFTVERTAEGVKVEPAFDDIPEAEREGLRKDLEEALAPSGFNRALAGTKLVAGKPVTLDNAKLTETFPFGLEVASFVVTARPAGTEELVLQFEATIARPGQVTGKGTGRFVLDRVSGHLRSMKADFELVAPPEGKKQTMFLAATVERQHVPLPPDPQ